MKVLDTAPTAWYLHKVRSVTLDRGMMFQFQYLDGLFEKDPKAGGQYHQRQVQLYATYDQEKLLPFLRSCTDIPLQKVNMNK